MVVKRKQGGKMKVATKKKVRRAAVEEEAIEVALNTEPNEPSDTFFDYTTLIYGAKKIGKTSLLSVIDNIGFFFTEPGGRALRVMGHEVKSWPQSLAYLELLYNDDNSSKPKFNAVAIDIVDRLYGMCYRWVCDEYGVEDPPEDDFGRIWGHIRREFDMAIKGWCALQKGTFFVSHAQISTIQPGHRPAYNKIIPTLPGKIPNDVINGLVDTIAYYGYNGSDRTLVIRGDDFIEAGTRLDEHFLTARKRRQVVAIDMGTSKEESYRNLIAAFDNRLTKTGETPMVVQGKRKGGRL